MAMNTSRVPLKFADAVSEAANAAWEDGSFASGVTPVTHDLLKHWFAEPFTSERKINFHAGQRQSILNVVYLHEVLGAGKPLDAYERIAPQLLEDFDCAVAAELCKEKYAYPKYCVKMATGTGKTWVMHALMIWQYLNARAGHKRFTKNFLFVAPGLIVYERLLDAFCGKRAADGTRNFDTSDIKSCEDLFVPPQYRNAVYGFLQNSTVPKEDFGRKTTGDGLLAVMNWHAFLGEDEKESADDDDELDCDGKRLLDDLIPLQPGVSAGNKLESLDSAYLRGGRLDFLKELPDLMLVNDEAHHIHGAKGDKEDAVKWQRGIDALAQGKYFAQLDFSATPYEVSGGEKNRREDYFPHVVSNFNLPAAIKGGFVKAVVIDRRKAITDIADLDYNAVRENGKVVCLSDGQRIMLRAGLEKLKKLELEFAKLDSKKRPKMLVVCEDTAVSPLVEKFFIDEGLAAEDVLRVDSSRQGEVKEWDKIKLRLFDVDRREKPRVIISVLMLREGFDVNNICVIVPLRATKAQILLEQTLGRGLRLMWREDEYRETKKEALHQLLVEKTEPSAVIDFLYIVEHPAFADFYTRLIEAGLAGASAGDSGPGTGDLVKSVLKEDFEEKDISWPVVMRQADEEIVEAEIDVQALEPFTDFELAQLKSIFAKDGVQFVSKEMLVGTVFGAYRVHGDLFNATSYNEYIRGVIGAVSRRFQYVNGKQCKAMPALQTGLNRIAAIVDEYIRTRLFNGPFDPFNGSDWKVLVCMNGIVTKHIVKVVGQLVHQIESSTTKTLAEVNLIPFSSVPGFIVRKNSSLELAKTIYTLTAYPSHGGGLEREFMKFVDCDANVERFVKINESKHVFARIAYLRTDGLIGYYIPDFIVVAKEKAFLVETKADKAANADDVNAKRRAALEWCANINALPAEDRIDRVWAYLLVKESDFHAYQNEGADFADFAKFAELTPHGLAGEFKFE